MATCGWVEGRLAFLSAHLGMYRLDAGGRFLFEPTPRFYGSIAQGTTEALNAGMRQLAEHVGAATAPVIEPWIGPSEPLVRADHDWTQDGEPPGMIIHEGPCFSRVRVAITNKHSPLVMGGILAHELTHHFLAAHNVREADTDANERLTDVATAYLGLGKLTLNGYEPLTWLAHRGRRTVKYTYRVGYLTSEDMALALQRCCVFRGLSPDAAEANLSARGLWLFRRAGIQSAAFDMKKTLMGQRVCPHCGTLAQFAFGDCDDGVYCSACGWEWEAILKDQHRRRRRATRRWWKPWTWGR